MKKKIVRLLAHIRYYGFGLPEELDQIEWPRHVLGKCFCPMSKCPYSRYWSDEKILSEVENKLDKNMNENEILGGKTDQSLRNTKPGGTWHLLKKRNAELQKLRNN